MRARVYFGAAVALLLPACFTPSEGVSPDTGRIYFPVGLALLKSSQPDVAPSHLFITNSDFDLQFNAGSVQSIDLARVEALVPKSCNGIDATDCPGQVCDSAATPENGFVPSFLCVDETGPHAHVPCGVVGERSPVDRLLYPGRCNYIDPVHPPDAGPPLVVDSVGIGAFATDVIYRAAPSTDVANVAGRLFIPVRGDASLHWIDVSPDGRLDCKQGANDGQCSDANRAGRETFENSRGLKLRPEPFAIDATEDGEAILVTNQTEGVVSLFVQNFEQFSHGPRLEFALGGLPRRPVGVTALPVPAVVKEKQLANYRPGFLVTYRDAAQVDLIRYQSDAGGKPQRPYVSLSGTSAILANSIGSDSRGIAIDASQRTQAEQACSSETDPATKDDCIAKAHAEPLRVFVANRGPASLLVGQTQPATNDVAGNDLPAFHANVPLTVGPSRVVVGEIKVPNPDPTNPAKYLKEVRVFIVCFDSRRIFIYDPERRVMETEIITGRGPHALAIDSERGYAYVGHFTDSYIGVVSLDQRFPRTYATMVATIGVPTPPRAAK